MADPTPSPTDIPTFARTQLALLAAELDAELAETSLLTIAHSPSVLQRAGLALTGLHVAAQRTGLAAKTVLELAPDPALAAAGAALPEHGFRVGDIVGLREGGAGRRSKDAAEPAKEANGVLVKVRAASVDVALDRDDADAGALGEGGRLWMVKLANDVTYARMSQTMAQLRDTPAAAYSELLRVVFGLAAPSRAGAADAPEWIAEGLNESQRDAVRFALAAREVALIHGPPGTGKTHTLVEVILQLVRRGQRVLVCGPSNIAVDNIVERLAKHQVAIVRLGHPARLLPSVLAHSLEVLTRTSDAGALVQDVRREVEEKLAGVRKTRSGRERREIYAEVRELRRELRERERGCVDGLVAQSQVVLATCHGAGGHQLRGAQFDVVVIDEASQALEAQCWVPLLAAKKAILAGDHLQLPPTIKSLNSKPAKKSAKEPKGKKSDGGEGTAKADTTKTDATPTRPLTLETTLFDRLLTLHGPSIKTMLTTQYRMHDAIMSFPSSALYDSQLVAAPAVAARLLRDLPGVEPTDDTSAPLVFYDTQGGAFPEKAEDAEPASGKRPSAASLLGDSKSNEHEAALVRQHVARLLAAGVAPDAIAVITPYNAQLAVLAALLRERHPGVELGSVDGFQGREKEAVVVTLVRSNEQGELGFLGEQRRLNVAMTRPKRHLCVIGDGETVAKGSPFLRAWVEYLEAEADLRYPDPAELNES